MGVLLVILPWSTLWDHNVVLDLLPLLHHIADTGYARGAVSGLGLVNLGIGLAELLTVWHTHQEHVRFGDGGRPHEGQARP